MFLIPKYDNSSKYSRKQRIEIYSDKNAYLDIKYPGGSVGLAFRYFFIFLLWQEGPGFKSRLRRPFLRQPGAGIWSMPKNFPLQAVLRTIGESWPMLAQMAKN